MIAQESVKDAARRLAAGMLRKGYAPTAVYPYANADGSIWCHRLRCDHPTTKDKWVRPMHLNGAGYELTEPPAPPEGKPLYRLPELLAADPKAIVWVTEGEKCSDALRKLGLIATTSGGASSADAADWTPCRGRSVRLWPDKDEAGRKYAEEVAAILSKLDCVVDVIDIDALGLPDKGDDCVDWLQSNPNATQADVLALGSVSSPSPVSENIPEPLPDPLPAVPQFSAALLPQSVRAWCEDAAEGLQVPLDFTAIPAMVALAGALGRCIGIALKRRSRWIERPVVWGAAIGRPSSGKSPAIAPARHMLDRLERLEREAFDARMLDHQASALVAGANLANTKKELQKALRDGKTKEAKDMASAALSSDEEPKEPRIVTNDATIEKVGELLNQNPRGLVMLRDEIAGWLASMDREGREGDRTFWLECWNGTGSYTADRIGRGTIRVEACAVSVLGGIQPGKLAEYVRGAVRGGFADDGLIQRFQLAVYPDVPADWRYTDRAPDPNAEEQAWGAFKRLRELNPDSIGAERADWADVPFLRFDDEAQELFIEWYAPHMQRLRAGSEPVWLEAHLAKYPALVGRLALVLHLADGFHGNVSADTLAKALDWVEYLEGHARRIYSPATNSGLPGAHLILKRRADLGKRFSAREVHRKGWGGLADPEATQSALDVLVEYGHLIDLVIPSTAVGGRPTIAYEWKSTP